MPIIVFILLFPSILLASCPPAERYIIAYCEKGRCEQGYVIEDGGEATTRGCAGQPGEFRASTFSSKFAELSRSIFEGKNIRDSTGVFLISESKDTNPAANLSVVWFGSCYRADLLRPGEVDPSCEKAKSSVYLKKLDSSVLALDSLKESYLSRSRKNWSARQKKLQELIMEGEVNGG